MLTTYENLLTAIATDGETRDILNPATGELVGKAPVHTVDDLQRAIATAKTAQRQWSHVPDAERATTLNNMADAIDAAAEPLARLLCQEQGKPLNGPNARFEVGACSAWLRATASFELEPETVVDDGEIFAQVHYRPLGLVGAIGPWNWPMMIAIWQIAPSLRMGNGVIVKPSSYTPLSVLALCAVINQALPQGLLACLSGNRQVGAAITEHPDIDKIMFTGSTPAGKEIVRASAGTLKRMTMELGGNDAGIVLDDANPQEIAENLFWGAFINTGQTCAALKRLYVPDSLYDAVCDELVKVAQAAPMGNGLDEQNVLGPLQNKAQFDIVDRLVKAAKDSGAKVLIGGNPDYDAPGFFYPTTLVADIDPNNPLVVEEQFGPALPIIRYSNLDEAIEQANALEVGLGSSVWSSNRERALEVAARIQAGTVWINKHGAVDPRVPFGGIKESGYGLEFGIAGLKGLGVPQVINI